MPSQKSFGLLIEPPSKTDYVAGDGNLTGEVINPTGDWLPFVPVFEHQAPLFETNSCASQATMNALEGLYKALFGIEPNHSDRMLAKGSGTDPKRGNSPQKVAEFFRKNWSVLEEDWPMAGVQTVEEYYKEFPDLLYSKAEIVRGEGVFGYEAITNPTKLKLKEALTKGVVCISVAAWGKDENDIYYKPSSWRDNHYVWLLKIKENGNYLVFDSYDPSIKEYRGDAIPEIAYRYTLNEKEVDWLITTLKALIKKIQDYLATKPAPTNPELPPPFLKQNILNMMCLAIQKHEGWIANPPSRSYRNKNPFNLVYVGQAKATKEPNGRFCVFQTYEDGFNAGKQMILNAAMGKSKIYHPSDNLFDFFNKYAPKSDNNDPIRYAEVVAKAMGVNPAKWRLKDLL